MQEQRQILFWPEPAKDKTESARIAMERKELCSPATQERENTISGAGRVMLLLTLAENMIILNADAVGLAGTLCPPPGDWLPAAIFLQMRAAIFVEGR